MASENKNRSAMERLIRLAVALKQAGRIGMSSERLVAIAGFGPEAKDPASQLARDFKYLREMGWQIENVAGPGLEAHFVMRTVDARLRLLLDPAQQEALRRAAVLANREDLVERLGLAGPERDDVLHPIAVQVRVDEHLDTVTSAVTGHRLLRFRYKGQPRTVHPGALQAAAGRLYLSGLEEGAESTKFFLLSRMGEVTAGPNGSARVLSEPRHRSLHPLHWEVDPPEAVHLRTAATFVPDVVRWLGDPQRTEVRPAGEVDLHYLVTNRRALRSRIYELGTRVTVLGSARVRDELLSELAEMAGES